MIKGTFRMGGDLLDVVINNNNILFTDASGVITTIEGIRLSKSGIIKENPDLENDDDWKAKGIDRFKKYVNKIKTENKKIEYVKDELQKHGYQPMFKQRGGFRPTKFK